MNKIAINVIKFYKLAISPLLIRSCRFEPSCSEYALQAYSRFGFFKGTRLAVWRILRCNPFSKGGYDPLPQTRQEISIWKKD